MRTDVEYQYTISSSSLCTICSLSRSVSMSMFDEGGTVGTLLKVIGLRWDRVRVSGEERSPDFGSPGAGGACTGGACTGGASAGGACTGCVGAITGRGGCGSISPAGVGKGLARRASGALAGRASCLGRTLGRAAGIIELATLEVLWQVECQRQSSLVHQCPY